MAILIMQFKLLYKDFLFSTPFLGVGHTVPFLLLIPGRQLSLLLEQCYGESSRVLTGRKMVFISMVYSFLLYAPLGQTFISLLTHFYIFSHSVLLCNSMVHLNSQYVVNFVDVAYFFFSLHYP